MRLRRLRELVRSLLLRWRVRRGKQVWGRQAVAMHGHMTMRARVYRAATDTWEDLGVISEGEV